MGYDEGSDLSSPVVHNSGEDKIMDQSKKIDDLNVQSDDVENVQEMVGSDVRDDSGGDAHVENTDNLQGEEPVAEEPVVAEIVKEEVLKIDSKMIHISTEDTVPDEDEVAGVREDFKEESSMANDETIDGVVENEEEETMVEDEEKSIDTEMDIDLLITSGLVVSNADQIASHAIKSKITHEPHGVMKSWE
ncbi:hypothetical protein L2E82_10715 [Cichorium intybus]|uniref:Uncharacterized protein n=1 Tax=Cichorium intybus TaxID=13427 RepID=A0ACB9GB81_CICIN|nr:hypothetical protein L2E82_10715 [Cichorium intybus]